MLSPTTALPWLSLAEEHTGEGEPQRYTQLATVRWFLSIHTKSLGTFDLTPLPEAAKQTSGNWVRVAAEFRIKLGVGGDGRGGLRPVMPLAGCVTWLDKSNSTSVSLTVICKTGS